MSINKVLIGLGLIRFLFACHNNCNQNGLCNKFNICECFVGYEGYDCSKRSCPVGPTIGRSPNGIDTAHLPSECSGRGDCDYNLGVCYCYPGFTGPNCGRMFCFNNCNGNGRCVSLREAASDYDGYHFSRITTYSRWDADLFYGCNCDPGWGGADCSQRICPYGVDVRISDHYHEDVVLVCECSPECQGKFKLRLQGKNAVHWLTPQSTTYDVANALTTISGKFAKSSNIYSYATVLAINGSERGFICQNNNITKTIIRFRRSTEELPLVSFYANLITGGGSMYFETKQILQCDCSQRDLVCNGTYRLSYDGEMSTRLKSWGNGTDVVIALNNMQTIRAAGAIVDMKDSTRTSICRNGLITNHTITFKAQAGNLPRLGLWSSIVQAKLPSIVNTFNTTGVLYMTYPDGRDDTLKLCNGIGTCDFDTGLCNCPHVRYKYTR